MSVVRYANLAANGGHESGMTPFNMTRRGPNYEILCNIARCEDPSGENLKLVESVYISSLSV
jgi:hypothetical protein